MSNLPPPSSSASSSSAADFAQHPNVHFDQATRKWTFESPDTGDEFEFNEVSRSWVPVVRPDPALDLLQLAEELTVLACLLAMRLASASSSRTRWCGPSRRRTRSPASTSRCVHLPLACCPSGASAVADAGVLSLPLPQAPVAALAARESKKRKEKPELDFTSNTAVSSSAQGSMTASKAAPKGKGAKKARTDNAEASGSGTSSSAAVPAPAPKKEPKKSTAVYITGLPLDVTAAEIAGVFSKCGIILLGADNAPRVKLYSDPAGNFRGEALVMYFKESSVDLAEQVMDDTEFRLGGGGRMHVKRAEWSSDDKKDAAAPGDEPKEKKKKMSEEEKRALHARMRKMESCVRLYRAAPSSADAVADALAPPLCLPRSQLTEWDSASDDEDARPPPSNARLVVLKHMFTLQELDEDATLLLDLKEDVREEAETLGEVTNVQVWDVRPPCPLRQPSPSPRAPSANRRCFRRLISRRKRRRAS